MKGRPKYRSVCGDNNHEYWRGFWTGWHKRDKAAKTWCYFCRLKGEDKAVKE